MAKPLKEIGKVSHFFGNINVAVIDLTEKISVGDRIVIMGPLTDIEQTVNSMEVEHEKIKEALAGQSIGLKVTGRVREKDTVYKTV